MRVSLEPQWRFLAPNTVSLWSNLGATLTKRRGIGGNRPRFLRFKLLKISHAPWTMLRGIGARKQFSGHIFLLTWCLFGYPSGDVDKTWSSRQTVDLGEWMPYLIGADCGGDNRLLSKLVAAL